MNRRSPPAGLWWITGASRGIGRAFALELARSRCTLALASRDRAALDSVAAECRAAGAPRTWVHSVDLSVPGAGAELVRELRQVTGEPLGVINNAGFSTFGPFVDCDESALLAQLRTNARAVTEIAREVLLGMSAAGRGYLLNVASVAGFQPVPKMAVYAATKRYVLALSAAIHEEMRERGVHVTALCPGVTDTHFFEAAQIDRRSRFLRLSPWMSAAAVARVGLAAVARNRPIAVPGLANRAVTGMVRLLPARLVQSVTTWVMS
jgi:uncharacterized protein